MVTQTAKIGGVTVGKIGHGLMSMTWVPIPAPDEQCFEAIKAGADSLPSGTKIFLNGGEFYGKDWGTDNLELLSRFYAKYPEYADKTFLSIKGGISKGGKPKGSPENIRASVDNIIRLLGPNKKLDLFEPARVDPTIPIEDQVRTLAALVKEGKFDHIGLSECNADTLRRAHAIHPIAAAEIEISPWSYEEQTKRVIATGKELGIAIIGYSPLGRGLLTGQIKSASDFPEGDHRSHLARSQGDNLQHNLSIAQPLFALAAKKGITSAQLSIAWVAQLADQVIPLPGSSKPSRTLENIQAGDIKFTEEELDEINTIISTQEVKGGRYFDAPDEALHLWG